MCIEIEIKKFANAYDLKCWQNFYESFPCLKSNNKMLTNIPLDILSALTGLLGEAQVEQWMNCEIEELDNAKAIDLIKTDLGLKALKTYILCMPN